MFHVLSFEYVKRSEVFLFGGEFQFCMKSLKQNTYSFVENLIKILKKWSIHRKFFGKINMKNANRLDFEQLI